MTNEHVQYSPPRVAPVWKMSQPHVHGPRGVIRLPVRDEFVELQFYRDKTPCPISGCVPQSHRSLWLFYRDHFRNYDCVDLNSYIDKREPGDYIELVLSPDVLSALAAKVRAARAIESEDGRTFATTREEDEARLAQRRNLFLNAMLQRARDVRDGRLELFTPVDTSVLLAHAHVAGRERDGYEIDAIFSAHNDRIQRRNYQDAISTLSKAGALNQDAMQSVASAFAQYDV